MSTGQHRLFLPWARRGLAGAIKTALPDMPSDPADPVPVPAAELSIAVDLAVGRDSASVRVDARGRDLAVKGIRLMGPGDVAGLNRETIAKVDPPPGALDMAPNLCPTVEFHAPDLPWQFTPGKVPGSQKLMPWLMLICVEEGTEGTLTVTDDGQHVLKVAPPEGRALSGTAGVLPNLAEAWAWAHVQVTGVAAEAQLSSDALEELLEREPHRARSRIICPRNLSPVTPYICALAPVFEVGRLSGLGLSDAPTRILSWDEATTGPLDVPVYHHWRFSTAIEGDFEALARRLAPQGLDDDLGTRPVDVQRPGFGIRTQTAIIRPPASRDGSAVGAPDQHFPLIATTEERSTPLGGALRPAGTEPPEGDPLKSDLADIVGVDTAPDGRPLVTPPVYGSWHAGVGLGGLPAGAPPWLSELSTSTRHRIAAGIGAEIVSRHKDALMEDIWVQYSAIAQINSSLDRARLSRAAGRILYRKHLGIDDRVCEARGPVDAHDLFGPVMDRIRTAGDTVGEQLNQDGARPAGPAQRRAERAAPPPASGSKAEARRVRAARLHAGSDPRLEDDLEPLSGEVAQALADVQARGSFAPLDEPDWPAINTALCAGLDPAKTQVRRARGRFAAKAIPERPEASTDPLHPIIAAPRLRRALAKDLRALSQAWMLPGLERLPQNCLSLLEIDRGFIEAVLAGANHALNAEMLWRGFPTDRRATALRDFWEGTGAEGDIAEMTDWQGALGTHPAPGSAAPSLMLVIRGDLLKRFPETMIYAAKAMRPARGPLRATPGSVRLPLFRGTLDPDVTFLAFDLDPHEVRETARDGGWFFMVEGKPTQPKFGLDETLESEQGVDAVRDFSTLTSFDWDPTYWGDLLDPDLPDAQLAQALEELRHIPVSPDNATVTQFAGDNARWGANSAHMAAICIQREVRLALHADALFSEDEA
ncbi:MAG: hypothetical protein AAF636_08465 [Pseudomonadota bacterium]